MISKAAADKAPATKPAVVAPIKSVSKPVVATPGKPKQPVEEEDDDDEDEVLYIAR